MSLRFEGTCPKCGYNRATEILALYQAGMSRHDIAVRLEVSVPTVRYHTNHLPNNSVDKRKMKIGGKLKFRIYELLALHKSIKQIATELRLPEITVEYHSILYRKAQVN